MMTATMATSGRTGKRGAVRTALDGLYLASGVLAGIFLAGIAVTIVAQIVGRLMGYTVDSTELAGFCMAASTFLGLAYTLKNGTHVRVTLVIAGLPAPVRRVVEVVASTVGVAASAYFTYFSVLLVMQSYAFGDTSPGLLAAPFWIPQLGMAIGAGLLTLAFVDELLVVLSGGTPGYEASEGVLEHLPVEGAHASDAGTPPTTAPGRS